MADRLPDEVWQIVFHLLPVRSRLKVEGVCRRWKRLMPYDGLRTLDLVRTLFPGADTRMDTLPVSNALSGLLKRCGALIKKISFGDMYLLITPVTINLVRSHCPDLEELDLSHCTVTESIIPAITQLAHRLKRLNLCNTAFTIRNPETHLQNVCVLFDSLARLEALDFTKTSIYNLPALPYLPSTLKSINLNQCSPLRPQVLADFLRKCGGLEELRLSTYCSLDEELLDAILEQRSLRILELSHLSFGSLIAHPHPLSLDMTRLGRLVELRELYVQHNSAVSDAVLEALAASCQELRVLNLAYNRRIRDFTAIARLRQLNTITVAATERFSERELAALSENGHLTCLRAAACSQLGASGLETLIKGPCGSKLTELNLSGQWDSQSVNDQLFCLLLSLGQSLEVLVLQGCAQLSDWSLLAVKGSGLPRRLRLLDLSYCSQISDDGILALSEGFDSRPSRLPDPFIFYVHQTKATRAISSKVSSRLRVIL